MVKERGMKTMRVRKCRADRVFDGVNIALSLILMVIMVYPLWFVVVASFSDPSAVASGKVTFYPVGFSLDAYKNVLENQRIWVGYRNTIFYTLFGVLLNLILTIPTAFVLSRRQMPLRKLISTYFLITMYFGGGLIPTYLVVKSLGLLDSIFTMVVLGGISVYNVIVARAFFDTTIPEELYEATAIDGGSDFTSFFRVALPLSAPIIAVMALYYGVARWNNYFTALIYINRQELYPLQLVLRSILIQNQNALADIDVTSIDVNELAELTRKQHIAEGMKYSLIFISSAPLLIAYPFVQKYFVKGMMIGAVKG